MQQAPDCEPPRLLLGISGSSYAAAMPQVIQGMLDFPKLELKIVVTQAAQRLLSVPVLQAQVGSQNVFVSWDATELPGATHVNLASWANLVAVIPASARMLGRLAMGAPDDLLSTVVLATRAPVLLAPAMTEGMWTKPAVQRNVATLRDDGIHVIEPGTGISMTTRQKEVGGIGDYAPVLTEFIQAMTNQ